MKLRNKKTGEIKDVESLGHERSLKDKYGAQITLSWNTEYENLGECRTYNSLAEPNEEWEDYEEPKTFWAISWAGEPEEYDAKKTPQELKDMAQEIGNYFDTKEKAERAVEKLKAWKRLKDKGFRLNHWKEAQLRPNMSCVAITGNLKVDEESKSDLDLLFGGEE